MQTPGGRGSSETDKCVSSMYSCKHQGTYLALERVLLGVSEMLFWDFQPAGNLKYLILFPFKLHHKFKKTPSILPSQIQGIWNTVFGGAPVHLLRASAFC